MLKQSAHLVSRLADVLVRITGLRRDWVLHAMAGVPVALYGAFLGVLAHRADINMAAACAFVAGLTFALTKEAADHLCNLDAIARGERPVHGVEVMDAVFSLLAPAILAAALHFGWI